MAQLELLARLFDRADSDAIAYRSLAGDEKFLTWRMLDRAVKFWSLQFAEKLSAGETILISSKNRIEVVVAILAGLRAGLRVMPLSVELSQTELSRWTKQSNCAAVVASDRAIEMLGAEFEYILPIDRLSLQVEPNENNLDRDAGDLVLQSSGTTGFPRLVLRKAKSLDAVASAMTESIGFGSDDRVLATLPLSHSYGIEHGLLAPIWAGSTVLLGQGLNIEMITRELAAGATIFPTVPSAIEILCDMSECKMPAVRRIYSAGGPLPRSVFARFLAKYGLRVSQLYGATEVGSVTFNSPDEVDFDPASVGRPMSGVEIRIDHGQVLIRADSMFDSYLDEKPQSIDGYFPTGDLGSLDASGRLTISGRLKLLIDVGGLKVNPIEIESVLREHPQVAMCVVVPIRQSETVFRIKAVVTPRDPAHPPAVEELRQFAKDRLATYKVPRLFEIRSSLPTTATGKILRHLVEST